MSSNGLPRERPTAAVPASARPPSMFAPLVNLFSSIWFGVFLLTVLFVYSSIGSSGVPTKLNIFDPGAWMSVRQMRPFQLTEFEWFNWWPFDLLIALICTNLVVATLRRIPFNIVNLGVWMIHSGIIIMSLGCVWYFSMKVEGDAPILRRALVIEGPGGERRTIPAQLGATATIGQGDNRYMLQVTGIDPRWELLSGDEKGVRAYKVSVAVQGKTGMFIRDLVADRPQYTQDIVQTSDAQQPMQRAVNVLGRPLVDEALKLSLEYNPQRWFYLMDSRALYLREVDAGGNPRSAWVQRRIHGLPRYNDHIAEPTDVWDGELGIVRPDPISVAVPPRETLDPLPGVTLRVSRYLWYASMSARWRNEPAGAINPRVVVSMSLASGEHEHYEMIAFDPRNNGALEDGRGNRNMMFVWASSPGELEAMSRRVDAVIRFTFPETGKTVDERITSTLAGNPALEFKPIEGTEYAYRVENLQDNVNFGNGLDAVAIVQIKGPQRTFTRWIFPDGSFNRDLAMVDDPTAQHNAQIEADRAIESVYIKGTYPPAPIVIAAGPAENDLSLIVTGVEDQPKVTKMEPGRAVQIVDGVSLAIERYAPRSAEQVRPQIVPRERRDRQMGEMMSLICLDLPGAGESGGGRSVWLPYHHFAFEGPDDVLRRFPYRPEIVTLEDGKRIELMYSRARLPLPAPVVLDDFTVDTHIGGFTGDTSSILDWQSIVRFQGEDGQWLPAQSVRVNKPTEFRSHWFFQAQWDPPDPARSPGEMASAGLNYTVLGVGNRHGVNVMLFGCCLSVIGMIYAFYIKPAIKRRRQQAVYQSIDRHRNDNGEGESNTHASANADAQPEPVVVAMKVQP